MIFSELSETRYQKWKTCKKLFR